MRSKHINICFLLSQGYRMNYNIVKKAPPLPRKLTGFSHYKSVRLVLPLIFPCVFIAYITLIRTNKTEFFSNLLFIFYTNKCNCLDNRIYLKQSLFLLFLNECLATRFSLKLQRNLYFKSIQVLAINKQM